jgi:hypothetical protein
VGALVFRRLPAWVWAAVFTTTVVIAITCALLNNDAMALRGHFDAFPGLKLIALAIAFLAPSGPVGAALIGLTMLGPVAEVYLRWTAEQRNHMPMLEPWQTVIFGLVALGLLARRRQHVSAVRKLARERSRRIGLARVARLVLSVRDCANTPLQTLTVSLALLRQTHAGLDLDQLEAAMVDLTFLSATLEEIHVGLEWAPDDLSFDSLERIAGEVQQSLADPQAAWDGGSKH